MESLIKALSHPYFKIAPLERAIGCKPSTISQGINPELPNKGIKKWIWPICIELANMGLMLGDWRLEYEEGSFVAIKDRDEPATVIEHRQYKSGETKKVVIDQAAYQEEEADGGHVSSIMEYRQSQSKVLLSNHTDLLEFLNGID